MGRGLRPLLGAGGLIGILKGLEIERSLGTRSRGRSTSVYPATTGSFAPRWGEGEGRPKSDPVPALGADGATALPVAEADSVNTPVEPTPREPVFGRLNGLLESL